MEIYRQGDVIIKPSEIPSDVKPTAESVIAYGEVTGHAHRFVEGRGTIFENPATKLRFLLVIPGGLSVTHEEHEDVNLPEGNYILITQREYDWFSEEVRNVAD
jgi:hypothetical protein